MKLSVIIPTWNGWHFLEGTLQALMAAIRLPEKQFEVIVVDDGGSDATDQKLAEFSWVKLVRRDLNGGFSAACNTGFVMAQGEWVLLLNNDMRPATDAVERLLDAADLAPSKVFAIRPRIERKRKLPDESYEHMGMCLRLLRGVLRMQLVRYAHPTSGTAAFPVGSGGAALLRRSVLAELEGFDELYSPFYWEDVDLGYRALARGWTTQYVPAAVFHHAEHGTIASEFSAMYVQRVAQRNAFLFHWLNLHDKSLMLRHLFWLPLHLLGRLVRGDFWYLSAFADALRRLASVREGRLQRASHRIVGDMEILTSSCKGDIVEILQR